MKEYKWLFCMNYSKGDVHGSMCGMVKSYESELGFETIQFFKDCIQKENNYDQTVITNIIPLPIKHVV